MDIIVETGSGISGANSYVSLASADSYFGLRGNNTWVDGDDDAKEAALIKACSYMETFFWNGIKTLSTQNLEWPRRNVIDQNGYYVSATCIPMRVKNAQSELAYRYFSGDDPAPDLDSSGRVVRERVDVIEVEYDRGGTKAVPEFTYVDALLKPFLKSSLNVGVVRA